MYPNLREQPRDKHCLHSCPASCPIDWPESSPIPWLSSVILAPVCHSSGCDIKARFRLIWQQLSSCWHSSVPGATHLTIESEDLGSRPGSVPIVTLNGHSWHTNSFICSLELFPNPPPLLDKALPLQHSWLLLICEASNCLSGDHHFPFAISHPVEFFKNIVQSIQSRRPNP